MHKGYQNIGDVESSHIIAYPNRRRMFVWIVLFGILALLYIPFIILPIIAVITTADARNQLGAIVFWSCLWGASS